MKKTLFGLGLLPLLLALYKLSFAFEVAVPFHEGLRKYELNVLGSLPNDPIKYFSDLFGLTALFFLIATLSISPLNKILKLKWLKYRRFLGVFSFFYAFLHMLVFFAIDMEFSLFAFWNEALDKPFLFFGLFAFFILLFMALTSTKKSFRRFHDWHRLIYLAGIFVILHYLMSLKVVTLLAGFSTTLLLILLLLRIKPLLVIITSKKSV